MNKFLLFIFIIFSVTAVFYSCYENPPVNIEENRPPKTYVFLYPDSGKTISEQQSSVRLHWWGDDPDGLVVGYNISIDGVNWTFTTSNDSLISFPISGSDTIYIFRVAAIDDLGAIDPNPAAIVLPLKNSPPVVKFLTDANNNTITIPETTFTVASFGWTATDLDGDQSINNIYIALNDTSQKISLPGTTRFITIKALPPFSSDIVDADVFIGGSASPYSLKLPNFKLDAENVLYVFAEDIAGTVSDVIRMPSAAAEKKWFVKKLKGEVLIVDDYAPNDNASSVYNAIFNTLGLGNKTDIWDIKLHRPGILSPMFTETLKLFKYVFWYTDINASMEAAQLSINNYINSGGRILISMVFPQEVDSRGLSDFLPVDSISTVPKTFIAPGTNINPTNEGFALGYPVLNLDGQLTRVYSFYPNSFSAVKLYNYDDEGNKPVIGFKAADSRLVFMGFLLHRANGEPSNLSEFFRKVFFDEFGMMP